MTMGRHSPPIDGTVTANGHALAPLTFRPPQPRGPVSALPQQQDDPGQPRTADKPGRWRHAMSAHRGWLAAVPIVLVNAVAFAGQLAFLRVHLPWPVPGQVLVAVTLESVAVYLAWQAHLALIAGDSALRLRLAAYSFAAVIGVMNYSHYMAAGWRPTFAAVTFGLMSVSSPWLWSVHSRRVSRDALMATNDLEAHAVRLGTTRWFWHPWRSAQVMFRATWLGVTKPADAIALLGAVQPRMDRQVDKMLDSQPDKTAARTPPRKAMARTPRDRARAVIARHPDWTDDAVAKAAGGMSTKTVQRARNGKTGSMT